MNVSSVSQLADAAKLLMAKLDALGFGNILANELVRIHKVYMELNTTAPNDWLEPLSVDSMTDLLVAMSKALRENNRICRVTGSAGMGYVLGLVQILFPRMSILLVEDIIIQKVEDPKIRLEFGRSQFHTGGEPTRIQLETNIFTSPATKLPIIITNNDVTHNPTPRVSCSFNWNGWLADLLQMHFIEYGLQCDQALLDACSDYLPFASTTTFISPSINNPKHGSKWTSLIRLLGPFPHARMYKICEIICRSKASSHAVDLSTANVNLLAAMRAVLHERKCNCPKDKECGLEKGATSSVEMTKRGCVLNDLWNIIIYVMNTSIWSMFINTCEDTVVTPVKATRASLKLACNETYFGQQQWTEGDVIENVFHLLKQDPQEDIAVSSGSCIIYPTVLETLSVPATQTVTFNLVDGQIVSDGRYYNRLMTRSGHDRPWARNDLREDRLGRSTLGYEDNIIPSCVDLHNSPPLVTICDAYDGLEIRCTFEYEGRSIEINLYNVIEGYLRMIWSGDCPHSIRDDYVSTHYNSRLTSIASPALSPEPGFKTGFVGVAMTQGNPVARFLCCDSKWINVFQESCCFDCLPNIDNMIFYGLAIIT